MAPPKYGEVELLEAGENVRRPMSKGRIVGVVVAMVAVVGLVGVSSLPKKQVSQNSRLSLASKALMKAFSKRSLGELKQSKAMLSFTAMQEGEQIGDKGLSIDVTVQANEDSDVEKPQIEIEFNAPAGKGKDLETALNNIYVAGQDTEETQRRLQDSPVTIESDADSAKITIIPPVDDDEEFQSELEEGMEDLKFQASLKLGRTLDELWAEEDERVPLSFHGIQFTLGATFAKAFCQAYTEASNEMGVEMVHDSNCQELSALTQLNVSYDMRYRDPAEMDKGVMESFPTVNQLLQMMLAGPAAEMPPKVKEAFKELDGKSDGIKGIAIRGLPNKFEVVFDCKNFKVSSVLKKVIELVSTDES